jgi:excisionase family DNA binding protein
VIRDGEFEPILLTVRDAAQLLAIGRTSVYQLIADGELEVIRIGRAARIPTAAVHAFVRRRREGSAPSAVLRR